MSSGLSQKEVDTFEEFWQKADKNRDGELTIQELMAAVKKLKKDITECELAGMFCDLDTDDSRTITKKEYMTAMTEKKKRSQGLLQLFNKYDKDGSKSLSRGEVIQIVKDFYPENRVHDVLGQLLTFTDLDGNGQVSFDEFSAFFG